MVEYVTINCHTVGQLIAWANGPGGGGTCLPPNFHGRAKINAKFVQNIKISENF